MKKIAYILLLTVLITACSPTVKDKIVYASYLENDFTIGSKPAIWQDVKDSVVFSGEKEGSNNIVSVKLQWSVNYLYVLFDVKDTNLQAYQTMDDHPKLFLDDMVEILIDANNDKTGCWASDDIIYHINLLSAKKDDRGTQECISDPSWNGKAVYKVNLFGTLNDASDTDNGYTVEMAIPWTEIGIIPSTGYVLGIDFVNGDNNGNGRQLFDWSGANPFRNPADFGTLILK